MGNPRAQKKTPQKSTILFLSAILLVAIPCATIYWFAIARTVANLQNAPVGKLPSDTSSRLLEQPQLSENVFMKDHSQQVFNPADGAWHTAPARGRSESSLASPPPPVRKIHKIMANSDLLSTSGKDAAAHSTWGKATFPTRLACLVNTPNPEKPGVTELMQLINQTWGRHCDQLFFFLSNKEKEGQISPRGPMGERYLYVHVKRGEYSFGQAHSNSTIWEKVWRMWHKVATTDELYQEFDWFGKIDTDAWLSVPNLRRFVQFYDPEEAHYMGHTVLHRWGNMNSPFNLGCGYIISRGALRRVRPALEAILDTPACSSENACPALCVDRPGAREDPTMGICLHGVGIVPENTLDAHYRQRFLPFQYNDHYNSMKYTPNLANDWYWTLKPKGIGDMHHCCSPEPILFHNYKPKLYKTGIAGLRQEFEAFEAKWTVLDDRPADVPPRPQCFLYNEEHVTFSFDEHRNVKNPPKNQRIYNEEGKSPCRAPDFTEYSSLSLPGV